MAALGWLMNLDFAATEAGLVAVASPPVMGIATRKRRYMKGYGYRHTRVWQWTSFLFC